jgi:hypothetical protein
MKDPSPLDLKLTPEELADARRPTPGRKGGRPKGSLNKRTLQQHALARKAARTAERSGLMPIDVLLHTMRGTQKFSDRQVEAAIAAAPYLHPKLSAVAYRNMDADAGTLDLSSCSAEELAVIRRVVERGKAAKLPAPVIEHIQAGEVGEGAPDAHDAEISGG